MASTTPTLKCSECSYENEPERVYCHNCGTKLDRSLLPKEWEKRESPERARKRIKRMTNPGGAVKREVFTFIQVLVWSALLAAVVAMVRPPGNIPPEKQIGNRIVSNDLAEAVASPRPIRLEFTEADVNTFLRSSVKPGAKSPVGIDFKRAFSRFTPGVVHIGAEQSLWGFPVYSGVDYKLEAKDGTFKHTNIGGNFGRLRVHPFLMQYADFFFDKIWPSLRKEHVQMQRMQIIQIEAGKVTMVTKPLAP